MNIENAVYKYVTLTESDEYKSAEKLISQGVKQLKSIRDYCEKNDLLYVTADGDDMTVTFQYTIKMGEKVDETLIPTKLRGKYMIPTNRWVKSITCKKKVSEN